MKLLYVACLLHSQQNLEVSPCPSHCRLGLWERGREKSSVIKLQLWKLHHYKRIKINTSGQSFWTSCLINLYYIAWVHIVSQRNQLTKISSIMLCSYSSYQYTAWGFRPGNGLKCCFPWCFQNSILSLECSRPWTLFSGWKKVFNVNTSSKPKKTAELEEMILVVSK